jgi:hypothetical protein
MLDKLQVSDFNPHLNETFRVHLDAFGVEPIELELVHVAEAGQSSRPQARPPFSIQFLGPPSSQYLVQHIYPLEHPGMGRLDLFLVPLGPESGRMRYEAIFA